MHIKLLDKPQPTHHQLYNHFFQEYLIFLSICSSNRLQRLLIQPWKPVLVETFHSDLRVLILFQNNLCIVLSIETVHHQKL